MRVTSPCVTRSTKTRARRWRARAELSSTLPVGESRQIEGDHGARHNSLGRILLHTAASPWPKCPKEGTYATCSVYITYVPKE